MIIEIRKSSLKEACMLKIYTIAVKKKMTKKTNKYFKSTTFMYERVNFII